MDAAETTHVISSCIVACLRQFSLLLNRLAENQNAHQELHLQQLQDEWGRYKIWCGHWGPYQPDEKPLDIKLQYFDMMRTRATVLLVSLHRTLVDTANLVPKQDRVYLGDVTYPFGCYPLDERASVSYREPFVEDPDETALAVVSINKHISHLYALSSKFDAIATCPINTSCVALLDYNETISKIQEMYDRQAYRVALTGATGLGKTTLAARFAQGLASRGNTLILWVDGSCQPRIKQSYELMGFPSHAGGAYPALTGIREVFDTIFRNLGDQKRKWLVVLDDIRLSDGTACECDETIKSIMIDLRTLEESLSSQPSNGTILITSTESDRIKGTIVPPEDVIEVKLPTPDQAIELLDLAVGHRTNDDEEDRTQLVSLLRCQPRAITQAACAISNQASIHPVKAFVWQIFDNFSKCNESAMDLLYALSSFDIEKLNVRYLERLNQEMDPAVSENAKAEKKRALHQDIEKLVDYGLVSRATDPSGKEYLPMNTEVREAVRGYCSQTKPPKDLSIHILYDMIRPLENTLFVQSSFRDPQTWELIHAGLDHRPRGESAKLKWAWLMCYGTFYEGECSTSIRLEMAQRSMDVNLVLLGRCHFRTLVAVGCVAKYRDLTRRQAEAAQFYISFLQSWAELTGAELNETSPDSQDFANIVSNVIDRTIDPLKSKTPGFGWSQNQQAMAQRLRLALCDRALGPEHKCTMKGVYRLSSLAWDLEQYEEAEQLTLRKLSAHDNGRKLGFLDLTYALRDSVEALFCQKKYLEAANAFRRAITRARLSEKTGWGKDMVEVLIRLILSPDRTHEHNAKSAGVQKFVQLALVEIDDLIGDESRGWDLGARITGYREQLKDMLIGPEKSEDGRQ